MKILIDTHILSWMVFEPQKMSAKQNQAIEDSLEMYVSVITFIEIAIKNNKTPHSFKESAVNFLKIVNEYSFHILNLTPNCALILEDLPLHHRDPFDRIMIAQAIEHDLTVISADKSFRKYNIKLIGT